MGNYQITKYTCDRCKKELPGNRHLNIRTMLEEQPLYYRLELHIKHRWGYNQPHDEEADLCQPCAIDVLTDALERVKAGERATGGTESFEQKGW